MSRPETISFPIEFSKFEEYPKDSRFLKVTIFLCHTGKNLNNSYFTKDVIEKAIPSLSNCPILGYIEENSDGENDFSDHRSVIVLEDGKYKKKYIGQAYGIIPESNNARFETRVCDDGIEREYLVCEGLIWKERYQEASDILNRDVIKSQSMELDSKSIDGYFSEKDDVFHFTNFKFLAACILGKDVEPGMINSTIELNYNTNKTIIDDLKSMVLKSMEQEIFQLLKSNNISSNDKTNVDLEGKGSMDAEFKLSTQQLVEEFYALLRDGEKFTDDWGYETSRYGYVDSDDEFVYVYDRSDNWRLYSLEYSVNGDKVDINYDSKKRVKISYTPFDGGEDAGADFAWVDKVIEQYNSKKEEEINAKVDEMSKDLQAKIGEYELKISELEEVNKSLQEFKESKLKEEARIAQEKLFAKFEGKLEEEELNKVKENYSHLPIEEIEKELFTILGRKAISEFSQKTNVSAKKQEENKIDLNSNVEEFASRKSYEHLLKKKSEI